MYRMVRLLLFREFIYSIEGAEAPFFMRYPKVRRTTLGHFYKSYIMLSANCINISYI